MLNQITAVGRYSVMALAIACLGVMAGGCNEPERKTVTTHEQTYESEPEMTVDGEYGTTTEMVSPGEMIVE